MLPYILKRFLLMIPTLLGITLLTFFIMKLAPGDPVSLKLLFAGQNISPQALSAELARQDNPLELSDTYKNFVEKMSLFIHHKPTDTPTAKSLTWMGKTTLHYTKWFTQLLHLDFGLSSKDHRPVLTRIAEALPITLTLNFLTILIVYLISIPLGVWSALKEGTLKDQIVLLVLFLLYSLPTFWVATLLLVYFAGGEYLNFFPLGGFLSDNAENFSLGAKIVNIGWHLTLPLLASVYGSFAFLSRFTRGNLLEVLRQDFIRTARAKGLSESTVLFKHALRNALIPLITLSGTLLPALLGGSVIIEQIFSIPGMGLLSFEAVLGRDQNMIMALTTITAFLTLLGLLVSDLLYVWVDPRINFGEKR